MSNPIIYLLSDSHAWYSLIWNRLGLAGLKQWKRSHPLKGHQASSKAICWDGRYTCRKFLSIIVINGWSLASWSCPRFPNVGLLLSSTTCKFQRIDWNLLHDMYLPKNGIFMLVFVFQYFSKSDMFIMPIIILWAMNNLMSEGVMSVQLFRWQCFL